MATGQFVSARRIQQADITGQLYAGVGQGPHNGVLVLHGGGGGGGYERAYARLLAQHGYTALCLEYFGTADRPDALAEIPLEYFEQGIQWLRSRRQVLSEDVGVVGFSRGGEAALLVGSHAANVGSVVGYVPSGIAFPAPTWMDGIEEEGPAWTVNGDPVPYLPVDEFVETSDEGLAETVEQTAASERPGALDGASAEQRRRAEIPVENIDGPVLLVSGGADAVWQSPALAERAVERLQRHDHPRSVQHRTFPEAGHAIRVPYRLDGEVDPDEKHRFGGTHAANARASAQAWAATLQVLREGLGEQADSRHHTHGRR
ncbi:acyl-CoA thioester hydrolase/BAAT C-terminal domain-containing protein [Halovenus rubra]|uniref:Acyl-CoA thioester hydrolase/BAAT C-terminal domain-containing protein n=2 Tax=Halovenus rubra TaxID=869890 RepID=A0ABD5XAK9_9EURY|nr:acyl-CoA thioester hydrolase/BAAT C-terminal domain-containing protein [Halovenus rubra]